MHMYEHTIYFMHKDYSFDLKIVTYLYCIDFMSSGISVDAVVHHVHSSLKNDHN